MSEIGIIEKGKSIPHNADMERAILGTLLINPDAIFDIAKKLHIDDFFDFENRKIYDAILTLFNSSKPIDVLTVYDYLKKTNDTLSITEDYVIQLSEEVPSIANINFYTDIIKTNSVRRQLINAARIIADASYTHEGDSNTILEFADKTIFDITSYDESKTYISLSSQLQGAFERYERLHKGNTIRGVSTGFASLDNKLSGFQGSDLIIIAGRPGKGKTALALDIARRTAKRGTKVAVFSLEMSNDQLVDRVLSAESHIDLWKLRTASKKINDEESEDLQEALSTLSELKLYIDDSPNISTTHIRATVRKMIREHGVNIVIVDYLQLITPQRTIRSESSVQQITEISHFLKQLAREFKIPVIALSQLSRDIEKRSGRPRLSDLRDSGSIEQDADIVMFIHEDDRQEETATSTDIRNVQLKIEKHRNGPTGQIDLIFNKNRATFTEPDTRHHEA